MGRGDAEWSCPRPCESKSFAPSSWYDSSPGHPLALRSLYLVFGMMLTLLRQSSCAPAVTAWAYSSMNCGYGYTRDSSGYCVAEGWYSTQMGCYETTIIHRECTRHRAKPSWFVYLA